MGAWGVMLTLMLKDNTKLSAAFDHTLHLVQAIGVITLVGGLASMLLNLWTVWNGIRRWPAKVWSIVLALSAYIVLHAALVGKLIGFGANY